MCKTKICVLLFSSLWERKREREEERDFGCFFFVPLLSCFWGSLPSSFDCCCHLCYPLFFEGILLQSIQHPNLLITSSISSSISILPLLCTMHTEQGGQTRASTGVCRVLKVLLRRSIGCVYRQGRDMSDHEEEDHTNDDDIEAMETVEEVNNQVSYKRVNQALRQCYRGIVENVIPKVCRLSFSFSYPPPPLCLLCIPTLPLVHLPTYHIAVLLTYHPTPLFSLSSRTQHTHSFVSSSRKKMVIVKKKLIVWQKNYYNLGYIILKAHSELI